MSEVRSEVRRTDAIKRLGELMRGEKPDVKGAAQIAEEHNLTREDVKNAITNLYSDEIKNAEKLSHAGKGGILGGGILTAGTTLKTVIDTIVTNVSALGPWGTANVVLDITLLNLWGVNTGLGIANLREGRRELGRIKKEIGKKVEQVETVKTLLRG